MKEIGLQLYTINSELKDEESIRRTFRKIAEMGYTQIQTAGLFIEPERFAAAAKEAGLTIIGTHYDWDIIRNDMDETLRVHDILGTTNVGIGGIPAEYRDTKEGVLTFIDQANEAAQKLAAHGCRFTYHNHSLEFRKFDGQTMMDYLIQGFDTRNITFVLDIYWLQYAGVDIRRMIERLAGRISMLHLKDMGACGESEDAPYITELGNGNMDFQDIISLAESKKVRYFVVEQDGNYAVDAMTSARQNIQYLKTLPVYENR